MTTTAASLVLDLQGRAFPLACGAAFTQSELPMLAPVSGGGLVAQSGAANGWNNTIAGNDSGTGAAAVLPPQFKGFNIGAFIFTLLWAIPNKTWIGLLALIPGVGLVMMFVLGNKGDEWAWQNRKRFLLWLLSNVTHH